MPAADAPPAAVATLPPEAARGFGEAPAGAVDKRYVAAVPRHCPSAPEGQIVVCGTDPDSFRLKPVAGDFHNDPVRAEMGIGANTKLDIHLQSATLAGGAISNRVMVGLKIKF